MFCVVFVTAKDKEEAKKISRALLEKKLIACANILPGVKSFFWWEGKIDSGDEVLLILKTQRRLFSKIVSVVKSLHSYQVPEIIALPVVQGEKRYLNWVGQSVI